MFVTIEAYCTALNGIYSQLVLFQLLEAVSRFQISPKYVLLESRNLAEELIVMLKNGSLFYITLTHTWVKEVSS